jgi:hypothetical protein
VLDDWVRFGAEPPAVSCRTPIMGLWCRRETCTTHDLGDRLRRLAKTACRAIQASFTAFEKHGTAPTLGLPPTPLAPIECAAKAPCDLARSADRKASGQSQLFIAIYQSRSRRRLATCSAVVEARRRPRLCPSAEVTTDAVCGVNPRPPSSPCPLRNPDGPLSASRSTRLHNVRLGCRRRPVPAMA